MPEEPLVALGWSPHVNLLAHARTIGSSSFPNRACVSIAIISEEGKVAHTAGISPPLTAAEMLRRGRH